MIFQGVPTGPARLDPTDHLARRELGEIPDLLEPIGIVVAELAEEPQV